MEIYTLDRGFRKQNPIEEFESAIWTERYHGDGDFELVVPASADMMSYLPKGQLMLCEESDQPMILEDRDINNGVMKTTGITLTQWLNNRIIRSSSGSAFKEWDISPGNPHNPSTPAMNPAQVLVYIVQNMCVAGDYLDGTVNIGIPSGDVALFPIPGLVTVPATPGGPTLSVSVPYGPVYDVLKDIAAVYEIGMKIVLDFATAIAYQINFVTYIGKTRITQPPGDHLPPIRFSPEMDSFTNVRDFESIANHKNYVYTFAGNWPNDPPVLPGFATSISGAPTPGFDLRVLQEFVDDIPTDTAGDVLNSMLDTKAGIALNDHKIVTLVDGEIVQIEGVVYGTDFGLGDVVEVEGNTGVVKHARITEYIRSQDSAGERAYPTLSIIN